MDFREQLKGFRIINPTHIQLVSSRYGKFPGIYQLTSEDANGIINVLRHSYNYKKSYIFHKNTSKYCPDCDSYTDSNKILKLYDKSK